MLTPGTMLHLAAELADAQARDDTESLAAIAWQLHGESGEDVAEIGRLREAQVVADRRSAAGLRAEGLALEQQRGQALARRVRAADSPAGPRSIVS